MKKIESFNRKRFFNNYSGMSQRYTGFTLSEVLIALAIIGVIAAITIPQLFADFQQNQNVKAWRKSYSELSQALEQMANDNGGDITSAFPFNSGATATANCNNFLESMKSYFKNVKTCNYGRAKMDGCYTGTIKALSDSFAVSDYSTQTSTMVLADGVTLFFYAGSVSSCTQNMICIDTHIFVDVNGSKLPNRLGKDVFDMSYDIDKKIFRPTVSSIKACTAAGWNCSDYYLLYDK